MKANHIFLLISLMFISLQIKSHSAPRHSIYGTKHTESLLDKIIVPNIKLNDEPIEITIEHLRWIVIDVLTQQEDFSDVLFINRSKIRGKKISLETKNKSMNEILGQLAETNQLEIRIIGSEIHFFDKSNTN
jgi:Ni,Fe-hydrogenase maturation factor